MGSEIVVPLIVGLLATPFAAIVTWALTRRKQVADVNAVATTSAVTSLTEALEQYTTMNGELREEIRQLRDENAALKATVSALHREVAALKRAVEETP